MFEQACERGARYIDESGDLGWSGTVTELIAGASCYLGRLRDAARVMREANMHSPNAS